MEITLKIYIQLFSIAILLVILFNSFYLIKESAIKIKVFRLLLVSSMLSLIIQLITWILDGSQGNNITGIVMFFNILFFLFAPFSTLLWVFYAYLIVSKKEDYYKKILLVLLIPYGFDLIIVFVSIFSNLFFYIDDNNKFVEGKLFYFHFVSSIVYLIATIFFTIKNRKKINKLELPIILVFLASPIIGGIIQAFFYQFSTFLNAIILSLIITFLNIQNRMINVDNLTGAYSRNYLEYILNKKLVKLKKAKSIPFSGVFIDLDDFKGINDKYGHMEGDFALKQTKILIEEGLENKGFISRFAGDEFVIIVDVNNYQLLDKFLNDLEQLFNNYNEISNKPYKITYSLGRMVYDSKLNMKVDEFLIAIDNLMIENKNIKKNI